jgi:imidazolonepropionase-like amidohydrolase
MKTKSLALLLAALGLAPWLCAQPTPSASAAPDAVVEKPLAITNTRLVDGKTGRVDSSVTILVQGQRIAAVGPASKISIPADTKIIDGSAFWVIPGLIDVHSHDVAPAMKHALSLGVTTVHAMPKLPSPMIALQSTSWYPAAVSPRLQVTTPLFSGGFPANLFPRPSVYDIVIPASVTEARTLVREQFAKGYRQIKIIQDDGACWSGPEKTVAPLSPEVYRALAEEARTLKMRVLVHVTQVEQARLVARTGCDAFMHGIADGLIDDALWREIKRQGIIWAPTHSVYLKLGDGRAYARKILADDRWQRILTAKALEAHEKNAREWVSYPTFQYLAANFVKTWDILVANTRAAHDHDIPIAVGSDQPAGLYTHMEMELLVEAGLTPAEVIVAATYNGARVLRLENEIGSVEVGKLADFVLLRSDPTVDIRNARDTEIVVKGGRPYSVSELRKPTQSPAAKSTEASPGNK